MTPVRLLVGLGLPFALGFVALVAGISGGTARKHGADTFQEVAFYSSHWNGNCSISSLSVTGGPTNSYTYRCDDLDTEYLESWTVLPQSYDGGSLVFEAYGVQTATDTGALHADVKMQCRGDGETIAGWGDEVAVDIAAVTGDDGVDVGTSGDVTPAGGCEAGDLLWWHWEIDATGTTTAMTTMQWIAFRIRY